ncbi:hypothetical protein [Janthinobacterium agaricidamnosum]|uniref:hypothetical protein n=1 Tax=Janthinobacterium agaricidamnosum TaxID=55508 RepID=UPI000ADBB0F3|nr:hypothetical protein [Janthinobacterium agaricidamnosum]
MLASAIPAAGRSWNRLQAVGWHPPRTSGRIAAPFAGAGTAADGAPHTAAGAACALNPAPRISLWWRGVIFFRFDLDQTMNIYVINRIYYFIKFI